MNFLWFWIINPHAGEDIQHQFTTYYIYTSLITSGYEMQLLVQILFLQQPKIYQYTSFMSTYKVHFVLNTRCNSVLTPHEIYKRKVDMLLYFAIQHNIEILHNATDNKHFIYWNQGTVSRKLLLHNTHHAIISNLWPSISDTQNTTVKNRSMYHTSNKNYKYIHPLYHTPCDRQPEFLCKSAEFIHMFF